jgi:hypothetical protein
MRLDYCGNWGSPNNQWAGELVRLGAYSQVGFQAATAAKTRERAPSPGSRLSYALESWKQTRDGAEAPLSMALRLKEQVRAPMKSPTPV